MSEERLFVGDFPDGSPADNVASIKNQVVNRLRASDEGVSVRTTDYFNHTYVPDIILSWPADHIEREVYIRTTSNPGYLAEDVEAIGSRKPIIMPLAGVRHKLVDEGTGPLNTLSADSVSARTLVADSASLLPLAEDRVTRPISGILSRAVLQGGRGLFDEDRARQTEDLVQNALSGAQKADSDVTGRAVRVIEDLLDGERAGHMTGLLHAVWLGSGAPASAFPGPTGIRTSLDPGTLLFLLNQSDITDDEFWRRIGTGLTLARLCEIEMGAVSENLQRLVNLNMKRLTARGCQVVERERPTDSSDLRWSVARKLLTLEARRYQAHFSPRAMSDSGLQETLASAVSVSDVLDRARSNDIHIEEIELEARGDRRISYKTTGEDNIASDDALHEIGNVLGADALVRVVGVHATGDGYVRCDLTRGTATGRTTATFYISVLLLKALPMLRRLFSGEVAELRNLADMNSAVPAD